MRVIDVTMIVFGMCGKSVRLCPKKTMRTCRGVTGRPRCAMDVPMGGRAWNSDTVPKFTRMHVRDPYKRLGVTLDASEEEIRGARNFLLEEYAGHERSMESIEAAYEKILMASFQKRKKSKINLRSHIKHKVEESPPWFKKLLEFVEIPPTEVILRRAFLFAFMGAWSVMNSAEAGPAFQAFNMFIYIDMEPLSKRFGALAVGWVCGSIVVPMIPTFLLQPTWTLELLTSLMLSPHNLDVYVLGEGEHR
ncbi:hypothetical protein QJS10_CPB15g00927 [Acorus calamus]|uniref:Uncharacterized protein n=1 Tax=Acorus calamus TaxID=4465 RepID=A0AAV9D755_ACOCL|nr:hypothetical protein QJS10_CPB15g00927 [Acorus calamus]